MPRNPYQFFDGQKSIPINAFPEEAWHTVVGDESKQYSEHQKMYSFVGILNRCILIRANALASMPWAISDSAGNQIYLSTDGPLPDQFLWMKGFRRTMYLTEASLTLFGTSYVFIDGLMSRVSQLRWLMPMSIEPQWDSENGLIGFKRTLSKEDVRQIPVEKMCYFTVPNPFHETLQATSVAQAALAESKVLYNLDDFARKFFERGAVKATVLKVDATTPPAERAKLKDWWKRFTGGVKNAWTSEVISSAVEPVVIGEGLAEIADVNISDAKAKGIASTLGIPHSIVFSDAANFATADVDTRNFYTHTILPDAALVEEELNEKVYGPRGLVFGFDEQHLSAFQDNEKDRAITVKSYTDAGMPLSIAVQVAGVPMPDGVSIEDLQALEEQAQQDKIDAQKAKTDAMAQAAQQSGNAQQPGNAQQNNAGNQGGQTTDGQNGNQKEVDDEIQRLQRWLKKRVAASKSWKLADFQTTIINSATKISILSDLLDDGYSSFEFNTLKALALQANPDDDEHEHQEMAKVERKVTKPLTDELEAQKVAVFEGNEGVMDASPEYVDMGKLLAAPSRIDAVSGRAGGARDALRAALIEAADLGVKATVAQFGSVGFGFNWLMANEKARQWAETHSMQLVTDIDETTKRHVRQQIAQWIDNGEPLSALSKELEVIFGKQRATLIASTEVTRAYAQANKIAYHASGVVEQVEWRTARDERVCPVCGPLHTKHAPIDTGFEQIDGGFPPAHPHCRCWIVPVVSTQHLHTDTVDDGDGADTENAADEVIDGSGD